MCVHHVQTVALAPQVDWLDPNLYWRVKSFRTFHNVQSQRYIVKQQRRKLKFEHSGNFVEVLQRLKQSDVAQPYRQNPANYFPRDSTFDSIYLCEDVSRAPIVIKEISFLDDVVSVEQAHDF